MTNADHDTLDILFRHAQPRPAPPADVADAARAAVRSEWRATLGKRRRRRMVLGLAAAATILLGVFSAFSLLRVPPPPPVQVASINKSFGAVFLLGEQAELRETGDLVEIVAGQTIVTAQDAGLAVAWGPGGSLRVDQNTRIEFTDTESVFLHEGRIYFDSRGATLDAGIGAGGTPLLRLQTARGGIQHVGTQYMARIDGDGLVVSVREGEVAIDGAYFDHVARRGEQVTLRGRQRPSVLAISTSAGDWEWLENTTPEVDVDGRSLYEFLTWVSRELGLQLEFRGEAETIAQAAVLRGRMNSRPADALRLRLESAALSWRIEEGVIYVGEET